MHFSRSDQTKISFNISFFRSFDQQIFYLFLFRYSFSYNSLSNWKTSHLFKEWDITDYYIKNAGANAKEMLWFGANYGHPCCITFPWVHPPTPTPSELIRRLGPLFLVDKQKCRDHTNEQKPQKLSSISTHPIKFVPVL